MSQGQELPLNGVHSYLPQRVRNYRQTYGETGKTLNFLNLWETRISLDMEALGYTLSRKGYCQISNASAASVPTPQLSISPTKAMKHCGHKVSLSVGKPNSYKSRLDRCQKEVSRCISFTVCWSTTPTYFPVTKVRVTAQIKGCTAFPVIKKVVTAQELLKKIGHKWRQRAWIDEKYSSDNVNVQRLTITFSNLHFIYVKLAARSWYSPLENLTLNYLSPMHAGIKAKLQTWEWLLEVSVFSWDLSLASLAASFTSWNFSANWKKHEGYLLKWFITY